MRSFGEDLEEELFPFIDSSISRSNSKTETVSSKKLSKQLRKIKYQSYSMAPLNNLTFTCLDNNCVTSYNTKIKKNCVLSSSQSVPLDATLNGYSNVNKIFNNGTVELDNNNNNNNERKIPMLASVYSLCRITKAHKPIKKHFISLPNDKVLNVDDKLSLNTNSQRIKSDESWHDSIRDCKDEFLRKVAGGFRTRPSRQLVKKATKQMKREHKATVTLAVVLGKIFDVHTI